MACQFASNPLPARVAVNRIWQEHFGAGLSRTPENFGLLGERPSHPQLIRLARRHIPRKRLELSKKMHRLIMLSSTYQMQVARESEGGAG